ncbi:hypothetical protein ADK35_24125, partial [Streptomyces viridochromogenes]
AVGDVDRAADGAGAGGRDGPISVRASSAGACTISGSAVPPGRGADGWDGAAGPPGAGDCWTVVQPERAETATVTRSVAVVVVRCTRTTLLVPAAVGATEKQTLLRTGDL